MCKWLQRLNNQPSAWWDILTRSSGPIIDWTDVIFCFRAWLSCQRKETQKNSSISGRHVLRDKLISFWNVLNYCSPGKVCNKSDENKNKNKIRTMCFRICLDMFDHAGRHRWAAAQSYCRSINQWFLQSWALSSAQHQLWCAVTSSSAAVTLKTSAVQVANGWP